MTQGLNTMSNSRWKLKKQMPVKVNGLVHKTMVMVWKFRGKLPLFVFSLLYIVLHKRNCRLEGNENFCLSLIALHISTSSESTASTAIGL
jgi:hypothetical protein